MIITLYLMISLLLTAIMVQRYGDLAGLLLGVGLAISITSLGYFWTLVLGLDAPAVWLVLANGTALWLAHKTLSGGATSAPAPGIPAGALRCRLLLAFTIGLTTIALLTQSMASPHGGWDAWAIWNLRARFMADSGQIDQVFSTVYLWSHPDYPVLLPSLTAAFWELSGARSQTVPICIGLIAPTMTTLLIYHVFERVGYHWHGLVAAIVLASNDAFLVPLQYADQLLGLAFLATGAFITLARGQHRVVMLRAAGVALGAAMWTKNEGILFALAVLATAVLVAFVRRSLPEMSRAAIPVLQGAAPFLATLAWFKSRLAPDNDLFAGAGQGPSMLDKILTPERYELIGTAFTNQYVTLTPALMALSIFALAALTISPRRLTPVLAPALVLLMMHTGYFLVYLITPNDLEWHLATSLDRLVLQLWPGLLFILMLIVVCSADRRHPVESNPWFDDHKYPIPAGKPQNEH